MQIWHAIVLGFIQGLTEFLPISSDGHLVLADVLLDLPLEGADALGFDILLHAGSLLAILIGFFAVWKKLLLSALRGERDSWKLIALLIVATIPGVIAGLVLEDAIGNMRSLRAAGLGFLVTAAVLIVGERIGSRRHADNTDLSRIGFGRALAIGIAQAIAILPGVSRSGSTISTARALGIARTSALEFSFLMALPIIGGAVAKTMLDVFDGEVLFPAASVCITGFVTAFIVSMAAIALLKLLVVKRSLAVFAWYLLPLGVIILLIDTLA
jgi:undecaprenyl-diphosphatase